MILSMKFGLDKRKLGPTEFLGYETNQAEGVVISLLKKNKEVVSLNNGEEGIIICNQTPFYGESGDKLEIQVLFLLKSLFLK
ncbi:MAG: hypothetical protein Ct9H300mP5_3070 [Candidatus Pelagibacterales bacterium]|nr:MAG: hypothetical protein Ct9H300mP5_3070 [Pelagibacterales bacterium]